MLLVLSPLEVPSATSATLRFLAALARLIPPPRVHRHCYHGVLAPDAGLRTTASGANSLRTRGAAQSVRLTVTDAAGGATTGHLRDRLVVRERWRR